MKKIIIISSALIIIGLVISFLFNEQITAHLPTFPRFSTISLNTGPSISVPTTFPSRTPIPTQPPRPIPHGLKGFTISSSNKNGPKLSRGSLNPYDPKIGEAQTISITVSDNQPIQKIEVTMKTDNGINKIPMHLISGNTLSGVWEGVWNMQDSYLYNYHAVIVAESANGLTNVDITLR